LEKNNDALHHNLEFLVAESSNGLVKHMFSKGQSASAPSSAKSTGKLNFDSVGSKFRAQLTKLLEKLKSTVCMSCLPLTSWYFIVYESAYLKVIFPCFSNVHSIT